MVSHPLNIYGQSGDRSTDTQRRIKPDPIRNAHRTQTGHRVLCKVLQPTALQFESFEDITLADVYLGGKDDILARRKEVKKRTKIDELNKDNSTS